MSIRLPGTALQKRYSWPFECPACRRGVAAREVDLCAFSNHEIIFAQCPICEAESTWLAKTGQRSIGLVGGDLSREERMARWHLVYPDRPTDVRDFPNCPPDIYQDYKESKLVLDRSARASAALARRALQAILHHMGIKGRNLAEEINFALQSKDPATVLPSYIAETVDLVRMHGNFGAHPIKNLDTGQVISVEMSEAEHCLLVVEELIDFYFERPEAAARKRQAANTKLEQAGKGKAASKAR